MMKIPTPPPSVLALGYDDGASGAPITCLTQSQTLRELDRDLERAVFLRSRKEIEAAIVYARRSCMSFGWSMRHLAHLRTAVETLREICSSIVGAMPHSVVPEVELPPDDGFLSILWNNSSTGSLHHASATDVFPHAIPSSCVSTVEPCEVNVEGLMEMSQAYDLVFDDSDGSSETILRTVTPYVTENSINQDVGQSSLQTFDLDHASDYASDCRYTFDVVLCDVSNCQSLDGMEKGTGFGYHECRVFEAVKVLSDTYIPIVHFLLAMQDLCPADEVDQDHFRDSWRRHQSWVRRDRRLGVGSCKKFVKRSGWLLASWRAHRCNIRSRTRCNTSVVHVTFEEEIVPESKTFVYGNGTMVTSKFDKDDMLPRVAPFVLAVRRSCAVKEGSNG